MKNKTKEAVEILVEALKKDKEYYRSWKANIAMAFKDEYFMNEIDRKFTKKEIHVIANDAADNFLELLIR